MASPHNWETIAAAKRARLFGSIPPEFRIPQQLVPPDSQLDVTTWPRESGWFTPKELDITDSTATWIVQKIASRTWTSEEVCRAFCKRAAAAHQLVGALVRCGERPADMVK
jgi:amidase